MTARLEPPPASSRRRRAAAASVVVGGLALAVAVALAAGAPREDAVVLVGMAALGAVAASALGALVLSRARRASVRAQALVMACTTMLATTAGVLAAAAAMFISTHDLHALLVVVLASAAVSVGAAVQLGSSVGAGARQVTAMARRLSSAGGPDPVDVGALGAGGDVPEEFASLVAELHDLAGRLAASRARQHELELSRSELVAWVSHDLRSPIATIRAVAEALDDGLVGDAETLARYHHQLRLDAERLTTLVDDLFELSRINSGALRLRVQRVALREVAADALSAARTQAELKGVHLHDHLGELPALDASVPELRRVLHNLLDNAIRHTAPGGRVAVEASVDGGHVQVAVIDQCGGIPDDDLARVFDVAFRGDAARGRDGRGGGLGLAIAKGLVEAHDGSIDVENEGGGCRFTVRLPRAG